MINQFEINPFIKKQLDKYLTEHKTSLKEAMDDETKNKEIAAILHSGFPKMVQKIYSLTKFERFFWEKRELLHQHLSNRLAALAKSAEKKSK